MEAETAGSRPDFLIRVQKFADMMIDRLQAGVASRDVDEKETRILGSLVLKVLALWEKALHEERLVPRLDPGLIQAGKKVPELKKLKD